MGISNGNIAISLIIVTEVKCISSSILGLRFGHWWWCNITEEILQTQSAMLKEMLSEYFQKQTYYCCPYNFTANTSICT